MAVLAWLGTFKWGEELPRFEYLLLTLPAPLLLPLENIDPVRPRSEVGACRPPRDEGAILAGLPNSDP